MNSNFVLFCGMMLIMILAGTACGYGVVRCPIEAGILKLELPECWEPKDVAQNGENIWVGDPKEFTGLTGEVGVWRHSVWIVGNMNNTEVINNETLKKRWDYFVNNTYPSISITVPGSSEEDFLASTRSYGTGRDAAGNLYALGAIESKGRHPWDLFGIKMIDKNNDSRMDACILMIAVEKVRFAQEMMYKVTLEQR